MNNEEISKFLVELRAQKGITQNELASYLGVSNKTISKWETGASIPDTFYLPLLSKYYDISIDELLMGRCYYENEKNLVAPIPMCIAIATVLLGIVGHFLSYILLLENNVILLKVTLIIGFFIEISSIVFASILIRKNKNLLKIIFSLYLSISLINLISYLVYFILLI